MGGSGILFDGEAQVQIAVVVALVHTRSELSVFARKGFTREERIEEIGGCRRPRGSVERCRCRTVGRHSTPSRRPTGSFWINMISDSLGVDGTKLGAASTGRDDFAGESRKVILLDDLHHGRIPCSHPHPR